MNNDSCWVSNLDYGAFQASTLSCKSQHVFLGAHFLSRVPSTCIVLYLVGHMTAVIIHDDYDDDDDDILARRTTRSLEYSPRKKNIEQKYKTFRKEGNGSHIATGAMG